MQKFQFPLDRALGWRRAQAAAEEKKLRSLNAGVERLQAHLDAERRERDLTISRVHASPSVSGFELAALDAYRKSSAEQQQKLARDVAAARQQAARQVQSVIEARRRVRVLEALRDRRWKSWNDELGREIDREAGELYLLRRRALPEKSADKDKMEHGI